MAQLPVKWFNNTFENAPQLGPNWGDLTTMLDAVLVNGFNSKTVNSITRSGAVATLTIGAGHLYKVDQVINIVGADQAEYNGDFRVVSVTATTLTFAVTGTPVTPATGTVITVKTPGLGFAIEFTGTNKRVYRSTNVLSQRPYLRVDNSLDPVYTTTYAKFAKVTMASAMQDVDTFTGAQAPFNPVDPTRNHVGTGSGATAVVGWAKWYYARYDFLGSVPSESSGSPAGNRAWTLVGDDRGFYFYPEHQVNSYGKAGYCFTDFLSYKQGDQYPSLLAYTDWYNAANTQWAAINTGCVDVNNFFNRSLDTTGKVIMRDHMQLGGTVNAGFMTLGTNNTNVYTGYQAGVPWPNGTDYGLVLHPTYLKQANSLLRGKMPGQMWIHNDVCTVPDNTVIDAVGGYNGRKFLVIASSLSTSAAVCRTAYDITGPWW